MKHGAAAGRRQMSQVQNSIEGNVNFEDLMSLDRNDEVIETTTEVSKAPSAVVLTSVKTNESHSKRHLSELPELKSKT